MLVSRGEAAPARVRAVAVVGVVVVVLVSALCGSVPSSSSGRELCYLPIRIDHQPSPLLHCPYVWCLVL